MKDQLIPVICLRASLIRYKSNQRQGVFFHSEYSCEPRASQELRRRWLSLHREPHMRRSHACSEWGWGLQTPFFTKSGTGSGAESIPATHRAALEEQDRGAGRCCRTVIWKSIERRKLGLRGCGGNDDLGFDEILLCKPLSHSLLFTSWSTQRKG